MNKCHTHLTEVRLLMLTEILRFYEPKPDLQRDKRSYTARLLLVIGSYSTFVTCPRTSYGIYFTFMNADNI